MMANSVNIYSLSTEGDIKLSTNFKVREFACKDGSDPVFVSPALVSLLQNIRDHFGVAVTINSGYRTVAYNKTVGGATLSQHTRGMAADIVVSGVKPKDVYDYVNSIMPDHGGIGNYATFTHVDVRTDKARF